jgi:hypothetical protein
MTRLTLRTIQRPRKSHRCAHCGHMIPPGVSHREESLFWDGESHSFRAHHDCAALWSEAFEIYGDYTQGMDLDLCEAIEPDESRALTQAAYDRFRGHYPHAICRLEYRWQMGDLAGQARYAARGLVADPEEYPEVYG